MNSRLFVCLHFARNKGMRKSTIKVAVAAAAGPSSFNTLLELTQNSLFHSYDFTMGLCVYFTMSNQRSS